MDLVVGATGILGSAVCHGLRQKGRSVRAEVRRTSDPAKVAALADAGVEVVEADLKIPESLVKACRGVTNVVATASSTLSRAEGDSIETVDRQGQLALVSAAKAAGISQFVFVSFPPDRTVFPLQDAKRSVEAAIRDSGMAYTILHPTYFREIWLSPALGFDPAGGTVRLFGDGRGRISWIALADVAAAANAALDNPKARNRTLALGGPQALSQAEIVTLFEAAAGRPFTREVIPLADIQAMIAADDPMTRSFGALMLGCAEHGCPVDSREAEEALDFRPSPIEAYIGQVLPARL